MELPAKQPGLQCKNITYLDPNPGGSHAVLLLHGLGADKESWPWQLTTLTQAGYRPLALDLPGFGASPRYGGRWTIVRTAKFVFDFCSGLGLDRAAVAGISMGGTVALQMALEYPDFVDRLILINTFASLKPKSFSHAWYFLKRFLMVSSGDRDEQADFVAWRIFPEQGQDELRQSLREKVLEANPGVYQEAMLSLAAFRAMTRLGDIKTPTLVISGERDTTVSLENQTAMARKIPGAKQVLISGGGHGVTVDHPGEVNQALLSFMQR
jgi:3-oxoadipate enol-lactonase